MALTELQLPKKEFFYNRLQSSASQMDNLMSHWRNLIEFINMVTVADLDTMGVAAGQVRVDLVEFRTVLTEMVSLYDGNSVVPTNNPSVVIDKIRQM